MDLSRKNQNRTFQATASSFGKKPSQQTTSFSWAKVASGQARTNQSFRSTVFTPSTTINDSATTDQSLLSESSSPTPLQLVQPFLKGVEKDNVLVDVTDIKDAQLLREAFQNFNKDMDKNGGYEDYCGRVPTIRKYLNRSFVETIWTKDSPGRNTILNEGIYLADGTFVKGFPSYPADAHIVRLKLDKLPFLPLRLLKADMYGDCLGHKYEVLLYDI